MCCVILCFKVSYCVSKIYFYCYATCGLQYHLCKFSRRIFFWEDNEQAENNSFPRRQVLFVTDMVDFFFQEAFFLGNVILGTLCFSMQNNIFFTVKKEIICNFFKLVMYRPDNATFKIVLVPVILQFTHIDTRRFHKIYPYKIKEIVWWCAKSRSCAFATVFYYRF